MSAADQPADGVWEAPPSSGARAWAERLDAARSKPGVWAKFGPFAKGGINQSTRWLSDRYTEFEFECHTIQGEGFIWTRLKVDDPPSV